MGIASFSATGLLGSFQGSFMGWMGRLTASASGPHTPQAPRPTAAWSPSCANHPNRPSGNAPPSATACRPVRVVRVIETPPSAASAGRMRISGRMADVCAELDRLAALESIPRSGALLQ
jgi:hypothetical protein